MIVIKPIVVFHLFSFFALLASLFGTPGVQTAQAAGIVVNTNADNLTDDGLCTLREAITTANINSDIKTGDCATGSGTDTITFAGNYTIAAMQVRMPVPGWRLSITYRIR